MHISKVYILWHGWSMPVCFCDVYEFLVCPEQLNSPTFFRKILQVPQILRFSSIFCIFEPFTALTVWFWDPSFHSHEGLVCKYYKRFKHLLMLQKETQYIKNQGGVNFLNLKIKVNCTSFVF